MVDAFPLQWPQGWPRTKFPEYARFSTTLGAARNSLLNELNLLGAKKIVINSNMEIKKDGLPYANQNKLEDLGIAVYFVLDGEDQCIPCDKWRSLADNVHAVNLTVKALRGLDRWGAKEMVKAAFRGFVALPDYTTEYDYFAGCTSQEEVTKRYKTLAKELHPDVGGSAEDFATMQRQYQSRIKMIG